MSAERLTYKLQIVNSAQVGHLNANETVLTQAQAQGFDLAQGCWAGGCGSCKAHIVSGEYTMSDQALALSQADRENRFALLCQTYAKSDLVIRPESAAEKPLRVARIITIDYPSLDIARIILAVQGEVFSYVPGQYIDLITKDGTRRSYSIANAIAQDNHIELHMRHLPGGRLSDRFFGMSALKTGTLIRITEAKGNFGLGDPQRQLIFIAASTGYAPVRAILEHLTNLQLPTRAVLYWGGRRKQDLYALDEAHKLMQALGGSFIPVVSDEQPSGQDALSMRYGMVHKAVLGDFPNLSDASIYACGSPAMLSAARHDLISLARLPVDQFFCDAFVSPAQALATS
jgi:CDP-4-dehydro-6-deoxyglucose reductase, E3